MKGHRNNGISCGELWLAVLSIFVLIHSLHAIDDIYSPGPYKVDVFDVPQAGPDRVPTCHKTAPSPSPAGSPAPRHLLIAVPLQSGVYPVVHLQHAFTMKIDFYTQLLQHVASFGYIVIAPQMPQLSLPDATNEISMAASVLTWYPNNLAALIKSRSQWSNLTIVPNMNKVVLAGHSRGGKVAFGLATGVCKTSVQFSGIAGLDPVDGTGPGQQTTPKILPNKRFGLDLTFPTLVVGAGLGIKRNFLFPPCAPEGVSHDAFFFDSAPLAYHFVAPAYGHMDYLDDELNGPEGLIANSLCRNGPSRAPMRKFAGGIVIAFLEAVFGNTDAISRAFENIPSAAPVELQTPAITNFPSVASV
ncbi:hypothetical protein Mapa_017242 [Marchantia paleacea]|nr:hypothetical protein Mapa_017242 [Marchantia paleacea]